MTLLLARYASSARAGLDALFRDRFEVKAGPKGLKASFDAEQQRQAMGQRSDPPPGARRKPSRTALAKSVNRVAHGMNGLANGFPYHWDGLHYVPGSTKRQRHHAAPGQGKQQREAYGNLYERHGLAPVLVSALELLVLV